jgi:hypothetical protein
VIGKLSKFLRLEFETVVPKGAYAEVKKFSDRYPEEVQFVPMFGLATFRTKKYLMVLRAESNLPDAKFRTSVENLDTHEIVFDSGPLGEINLAMGALQNFCLLLE